MSAILSMMIAIRRRDDGPLPKLLSFVGWFCIFLARTLIFSVTTSIFGPYILIPLGLHVLFFTVWIYKIAIDSFRSERIFVSNIRRFLTAILVLFFFGIPSLFLWPIMFQLKENGRPIKFLVTIIVENLVLLLFCLIWFMTSLPTDSTSHIMSQTWMWFLLTILVTTIVGCLFVYLYVCLKPELTDRVVRHDIIKGIESKNFGVYFEFFEILFRLPDVENDVQDLGELRESDMYQNIFGKRPSNE